MRPFTHFMPFMPFAFPRWLWIVAALIVVFVVVFWLWALIDCLSSKLRTIEKLLWVIIIIFFPFFGALLYAIFSRGRGGKAKGRRYKGKRLFRSRKDRIIAGVCGGLGKYLEMDPTVIRLLWVLLTLASLGTGIVIYIIAWIIVPKER